MPTLSECMISSLSNQGFISGSLNERLYGWLADQTGLDGITLNEQWFSLLSGMGYVGTLNEMQLASFLNSGAPAGSSLMEAALWFWCDGGGVYPPEIVVTESINGACLFPPDGSCDATYEYICTPYGFVPAPSYSWSLEASQNECANSLWTGASGSIGGGDFVNPVGWNNGFWPPDEATVVDMGGYNAVRFQVSGNRGYLNQTVDTSALIGAMLYIGAYVSEFNIQSAQRVVHITGDVTEISRCPIVQVGDSGWYEGAYRVTGPSAQLRVGAGTSGSTDMDFTIGRVSLRLEPNAPYESSPRKASLQGPTDQEVMLVETPNCSWDESFRLTCDADNGVVQRTATRLFTHQHRPQ